MVNNIYRIFISDTKEGNTRFEEVDLDSLKLNTIFSVEELRDISLRKDNITKSISLKGTKNNNRIFGALYAIDRDPSISNTAFNILSNYKPNVYVDCVVYENNIQIIEGKMLINDIAISGNEITYNCNIVGRVFSFFSELNDRLVEELDYFNQDIYKNLPYNQSGIEASWTHNELLGNLNLLSRKRSLKGAILDSDGTINTTGSASPYHMVSDYISVDNGVEYTFNKTTNPETDKYFRIRWYDVDKEIITYVTNASNTLIYTPPTNARYVRLSYPENCNVKVEKSSAATAFSYNPDDFIPHIHPLIDYGGNMEVNSGDVLIGRNYGYVRYDHFRPAIYVKAYLDAIFNGFRYSPSTTINTSGWTQLDDDGKPLELYRWNSSLKLDSSFNKMFIPHNDQSFTTGVTGISYTTGGQTFNNVLYAIGASSNAFGWLSDSVVTTQKGYYPLWNTLPVEFTSIFDNKWFDVYRGNTTPSNDSSNNSIIISARGNGKLRIRLIGSISRLTGGSNTNNPDDTLAIKVLALPKGSKNREEAIEVSSYEFPVNLTGGQSYTFGSPTNTLPESSPWTNLEGELTIVLYQSKNEYMGSYLLGSDFRIIIEGEETNGTAIPVDMNIQWGDTFNLHNALPRNIKVTDLLKNIMLLNNLYLVADKSSINTYNLYTYNDFYSKCLNLDKESALDWTDKVDFNKYNIKSNINLPREYLFTYKADNDTLNELYNKNWSRVYGDYKLTDTTGLSDSKTVELMFSPTILYKGANGINIPVIYKGELGTDKLEQMKSNIRVMYFSGFVKVDAIRFLSPTGTISTPTTSIGVFDGNNNAIDFVSFTNYPFSSMTLYPIDNRVVNFNSPIKTLNFGLPMQSWSDDFIERGFEQTLFNIHYLKQTLELTDKNLQLIETDVWLNEFDVNQLDFSRPIYIQTPYGAAYFKLVSVNYIDSTTVSKVTMQKIVLPNTNRE